MSHHIRSVAHVHPSSSWASTSSPYATSSSSAHANLLGSLINKYPPGLGYGSNYNNSSDWRVSSHSSSSSLNGPASSGNGGNTYNPYTKRRSTWTNRPPVSSPSTPFSRRPAPPPPMYTARVQPPSTTYKLKFDPFSDENGNDDEYDPLPKFDRKSSLAPSLVSVKQQQAISDPVLYRTPRSASTQPASVTALSNNTYTIKLEPLQFAPPPPPVRQPTVDRNARSKLVAGILLNRVYAVGKPMRRRCVPQVPKEYVKSSLSSVISLEA